MPPVILTHTEIQDDQIQSQIDGGSGIRTPVWAGIIFCFVIALVLVLGKVIKSPKEVMKSAEIVGLKASRPAKTPEGSRITEENEASSSDKEHEKTTVYEAPREIQSSVPASQELQRMQKGLEEILKLHQAQIASFESELKSQKQENMALKERIENAKKNNLKPDLQETAPHLLISEIMEERASYARKKRQEAQERRKQKEAEWSQYFKKFNEGTAELQEKDVMTEASSLAEELKKSYSEERSAVQSQLRIAKETENRLSPGRQQNEGAIKFKQVENKYPSQEVYDKTFQGLISLGNEKGDKPSVQWTIVTDPENGLRDVYSLFGMTALIRKDFKYYSLSTGESIPEYKIDSFAETGILSEFPWRDFGDQLETVQRRTGMDLSGADVIYFMSDRMLRYFRSKVDRAIRCAVRQGHITKMQLETGHLRVVGRVLAIITPYRKHRFGVYVPTLLEYFDKAAGEIKDIYLDTNACFLADPDISHL